ncbi:peptide ABC transporter substrate-binding protein [Candidatus Neptunochlamydia vexilliferae]|uniref:Oligopeptide-binding protein OppA n=1 Tax=Candidatus Neptunichlamydia vexilliferae TaxID=1651774 RepID=A0ABS0AZ58_9BACT|nr:peptide ABC transporter substrate-binding protein [Candidatus Neptunochlamydia vexilliferae]MBF5059397.1 Oligopeptide-binding protein OppA [Candidatus Neptunochlamydia vexilliferae]
MKRTILLISIPILVILIGFFALDKKQTEKKNILKIALPSDIQSFHPARGHDNNSTHVTKMLFEGLMRKDENDIPQPAVARKVDISKDKKTYTFHLRDCKWSDGTEITAHDFEYSWKSALNPNSRFVTQVPYFFYCIKNAKACLSQEKPIDALGVKAIDDKTLSVELEYPSPYFLEITTITFLLPIPKHIAEKDPEWLSKPNLVCNGPFKLDSRRHNSKISLLKNPLYWDQEHVYLNGINIFIIPDTLITLNMFEKEQLDWVGSPFFRISYDLSFDILSEKLDDALIYWFFINTEKYPLNNKKLRKALSYAVNRQSIVKSVFNDLGNPEMSALSPPLKLTDRPYFKDNDTQLAQQFFQEALDELGITREELPEIELSYAVGFEIHHRIAQAIQDQWRKVLNIKNVSLRREEWGVYYNRVSEGDYDLGFMGWNPYCLDPYFFIEVFRKKDDMMNKSNWENEAFKRLLDEANHVLDETERATILMEAEKILMDEMPIIPICSLNKRFAKNPKLAGEALSRLQSVDFKSAYFTSSN